MSWSIHRPLKSIGSERPHGWRRDSRRTHTPYSRHLSACHTTESAVREAVEISTESCDGRREEQQQSQCSNPHLLASPDLYYSLQLYHHTNTPETQTHQHFFSCPGSSRSVPVTMRLVSERLVVFRAAFRLLGAERWGGISMLDGRSVQSSSCCRVQEWYVECVYLVVPGVIVMDRCVPSLSCSCCSTHLSINN